MPTALTDKNGMAAFSMNTGEPIVPVPESNGMSPQDDKHLLEQIIPAANYWLAKRNSLPGSYVLNVGKPLETSAGDYDEPMLKQILPLLEFFRDNRKAVTAIARIIRCEDVPALGEDECVIVNFACAAEGVGVYFRFEKGYGEFPLL